MSEPNGGNAELTARLGAKMRGYRDKLKAEQQKTAELSGKIADIEKQLGDFKAKAGTADEKDQRIAALEYEISVGKHRSAFARIAREAGVNPNAIDDAFTLSGYKAEGEPDEAKIKAIIEAQREPRAFLFGKQAPGAGASRGGETESRAGFPFTQEQMSNPAFVMQNYDAIVKARKERLNAGA